jgi:flagellar hook-length control protein FliK
MDSNIVLSIKNPDRKEVKITMNNGQIAISSVPTAIPSAAQVSTVSVDVTGNVAQPERGTFAGLLSNVQQMAREKQPQDSVKAGPLAARMEALPVPLDTQSTALPVEPPAELLAGSHESGTMASSSALAAPSAEKTLTRPNAAQTVNDLSDVMSQMALMTYSGPGRAEISKTIDQPAGQPQNAVAALEAPAVVTVAPETPPHKEQPDAEAAQAAQPQPTMVSLAAAGANEPVTRSADRSQNAAAALGESKVVITALKLSPDTEQPAAEAEQAAQPASTAEEAPEVPKAETRTAPLPIPVTTSTAEQAAKTAAPVTADNRFAAQLLETRGNRQRSLVVQQSERVRMGNNEQSAVTEVATSLHHVTSIDESLLDSDTSHGDGDSQGQSGTSSGNQFLAQGLHGQLRTEHQGVSSVTTKPVPAEPVRQDVPEQVMSQVKERLGQHDVKPGNQQITLILSPDTLGELKMNLNLQGQKLSVEIVTENRTVRDAIVQHTDTLKESLARQNITMESFDVTTGGKGSGNQGQNQSAWRELAKQQQQQQFWASPRGYNIAQADLPSGQGYQRQSMLDIHY